ncbi:MAG: Rrf2 family transcriptional regulator [Armatimonadetes bacterium]|nr:Rrf2 family transcriptional regulator [Armatimonadota bacterium]MBS1700393.1 Rrf2 family transcriptional regulator [Armatimonadota bacterium]MBS1725345.1 Rrf2 family transcriptional regulator [Armatimonadota bacterium]
MKFSAQEEYGLRCLIQIAKRGDGGSVTIPEISKLEGLTSTHAAKLLMILRKEGYITSARGQSGGYSLARKPNEIMIGDVLNSLGGKLYDAEFCGKHSGALDICTHAVDCSVRSLWQVIQGAVDSVLDRLTLADMLESQKPNVTFFDSHPRQAVSNK